MLFFPLLPKKKKKDSTPKNKFFFFPSPLTPPLFILCHVFCLLPQDVNHVYYETEFRTEWCRSNSTSVPCFLFARKFSRAAAMRLLGEGVVGHFGAAALLDTPP